MDGAGLAVSAVDVVDGDTLILQYSLEFGITRRAHARLFGVDTAETFGRAPGTPERVAGEKQREYARAWLTAAARERAGAWPFLVEYHGPDKYGRDLVTIRRRATGESLNAALVEAFPEVARPARGATGSP